MPNTFDIVSSWDVRDAVSSNPVLPAAHAISGELVSGVVLRVQHGRDRRVFVDVGGRLGFLGSRSLSVQWYVLSSPDGKDKAFWRVERRNLAFSFGLAAGAACSQGKCTGHDPFFRNSHAFVPFYRWLNAVQPPTLWLPSSDAESTRPA
ncbi:hypothetical protein AK812_SmicGene816 [Symbiodinium microadriaticum]|uniref:Uncharacterized protein n=1 Tax=Symbiodinium microadriaticum TaxID=2951 RepID=A0A1Q9F5M4_SYMMI|nr:hypothetical protein AK812_SmicGene816 [Symbiodinium microadriaticum]